MAVALDTLVEGDDYWALSQTPAHKKFRKSPAFSDGLGEYFGATSLCLHPDVSNSSLHELFDMLSAGTLTGRIVNVESEMARLAAHPNSDETLPGNVLEKIKEKVTSGTKDRFKGSKFEEAALVAWAEHAGINHAAVSSVRECSAASLGIGFEKREDPLRVITHKNFPWTAFDAEEIRRSIDGSQLPVALASKCLFHNPPPSELTAIASEDQRLAALFSPSLSSRAISKIVAESPDLAPLAAIHPNADPISGLTTQETRVVNSIKRPAIDIVLAGKGRSDTKKLPVSTLEI